MTESEFIEATARMERYYEKELNQEQRKFWFENLKNTPIENYKKITYELMKNCKYFPKFADLTEIRKNTNFDQIIEKKEIIYEKCDICKGTGVIRYFKKVKNGKRDLKYEYLARCSCKNSENYNWKDKDGNYVIPQAVEIGLIGG